MEKTIDESKARPDVGCTELFGIFQWGELKASGTKTECERKAKRWTDQHGNIDLEVISLPNASVSIPGGETGYAPGDC